MTRQDLDDGSDMPDEAANDSDPMSEDDHGDDVEERHVRDAGHTVVGVVRNEHDNPRSSKFMPPIEVEQQMKYLWRREAKVLDLVFDLGRATQAAGKASPRARHGDGGLNVPSRAPAMASEEGFRMFFIRALAVPPNRFRPPMQLGEMVAEHAQNIYLAKVIGFIVGCGFSGLKYSTLSGGSNLVRYSSDGLHSPVSEVQMMKPLYKSNADFAVRNVNNELFNTDEPRRQL